MATSHLVDNTQPGTFFGKAQRGADLVNKAHGDRPGCMLDEQRGAARDHDGHACRHTISLITFKGGDIVNSIASHGRKFLSVAIEERTAVDAPTQRRPFLQP